MCRTRHSLLWVLSAAVVFTGVAFPAFAQQEATKETEPPSNDSLLDQFTDGLANTLAGTAGDASDERPSASGSPPSKKGIVDRITRVLDAGISTSDNRKITVREIILFFLVLTIGIFLSRRLMRWLHKRALSHPKLDANAAATVEKGMYYFLLLVVFLFALNLVGIPLTVFAFVGGALAIGIGFGAQNLINNFISGLIIMMERPIRINDVVEVNGERGRIVMIGARCSRLHLFSGVDILVPNSAFLEQNVINWTLADPYVRFSVNVGVAYGSPTKKVAEILMQTTVEHYKILEEPSPVVLFADFGDNALLFEVYYWVRMTTMMDARVVSSEIRFQIDEMLRAEHITIAFPQSDVHLDTLRPLEVRVVNEKEQEG